MKRGALQQTQQCAAFPNQALRECSQVPVSCTRLSGSELYQPVLDMHLCKMLSSWGKIVHGILAQRTFRGIHAGRHLGIYNFIQRDQNYPEYVMHMFASCYAAFVLLEAPKIREIQVGQK